MALWDDITRNVGNFFGINKKKQDEEQNRNRPVSSPTPAPTNPSQPRAQIQTQTPQNVFQGINSNLKLPGAPTTKTAVPTVKPQQPKPINFEEGEADRIPGFRVMSPQKQQQELNRVRVEGNPQKRLENAKKALKAGNMKELTNVVGDDIELFKRASNELTVEKKRDSENRAKFWGGIPLIGTALNWGAGLGAVAGKVTGNKELEDRANNQRNLYSLGMNTEELNQYDEETRKKLGTLQNVVTALGGLDVIGASSLLKAPIISGIKKGATEGFKTQAGKEIIQESLKQTGKQYGKNIVAGGVVSGAVDPAIQAYIKDGQVDWSSVPSSVLQGGLWAAALPEFNGKQRIVQKLRAGEMLTADESQLINNAVQGAEKGGGTKIQVQQPRDIPVTDNSEPSIGVQVNNNTQPKTGQPIVEIGGDTPGINRVTVPTPQERATERFNNYPAARPDYSVEGMVTDPRKVITQADKDQAQATLDDSLRTGKITDEQHQQLTNDLSKMIAQDAPAPKGEKIQVQEVKSIPVTDQTVVPTDLPEVPGTVRATQATAPNNARTAEVAAQSPTPLPADVQNVLDNPKQFNKRQVAAARNQRKLARQMAKTQEQTAEALDRIQSVAPGAQSAEGFVPTGEFGKSVNGGAYQKANRQAEMAQAVQETANLSPVDVVRTARTNQSETGGFNRRDIRNIAALFEQKRLQRGTPEWDQARQILKEDGTIWGQTGALRNYTMRRTASADELISRFESKIYRLADDPSKLDSKLFDEVDAAETKFVETRDLALQAYNRFTEAPTSANAKAYHAAQDAAESADKEAKMVEFKVANTALKGNKDVKQVRELEKMAQSADMYQMDAVDASMLSGTGTFVRNFVNASVGGVEEGLFGKAGAKLASLTPKSRKNDIKVGGGFGGDNITGFGEGMKNIVDASKARASVTGKNPLEHAKNWATTGNQLGDAVIDSQAKHNVNDHYRQVLEGQGYKGRELTDRASVMARQDPDNISDQYTHAARVAAGLGSGITRNNKIETLVKNLISDGISGGNPNKYTEGVAKLVTRMTLGFPTAIGRSVVEGSKRFSLGAPTFIKALLESDPQKRAILMKEGIKQAGSGGLVLPSLFYALGASGAITGAYPKDDDAERERWQREGITENSIKIGDDYYQLPAYLGAWAIPGLFYASLGRNGGDWAAAAADTAKTVPSLLPTDQLTNVTDVLNGRSDFGKFMSQTGASAVRAATPVGALFGQIAKSLDPTQNDTNSGDAWENFVDKIVNGIPVASKTLPDKTDSAGNPLTNPDPLALAFGASSTVQGKGEERTAELNEQTNGTIQAMADLGAFADPNLKAAISDEKTLKIYNDIIAGKQVNEADIKKLQEAMVKGVSSTGDDTAYLEREQYESNLAALNIKRGLMASDPTTKPSDLKKVDTAIKRGQVYADGQIPYDLISDYQTIGVEEWRNMGDPDDEAYDLDMYQKLYAIDQAMTQAGVSYKKGSLDKPKYNAKSGGSGGGRGSGYSSDFGTLKAGTGAPNVQQYDTIEQRSGSVPVINVQRPNIVHKIGFSG